MLRLVEVALFLVPFAAFAAGWLLSARGGPSPALVAITAAVAILLGVALVWYGTHESLGPGMTYVPAHVENGEIVPGHAASR